MSVFRRVQFRRGSNVCLPFVAIFIESLNVNIIYVVKLDWFYSKNSIPYA